MRFKTIGFLVFLLWANSISACGVKLYGEWSYLGCYHEKLTIVDFLRKTHRYDYYKQYGHKDFRTFSFYKNFRFFEVGADYENAGKFKFTDKHVTIYLTKTYLFYDFEIVYRKGKRLIMFDSLSNLFYYFIKNKNSSRLPKLTN